MTGEETLGHRLGQTTHVSPLRMKLRRLKKSNPGGQELSLEDWLLDLANARGVRSISRIGTKRDESLVLPGEAELSNEELVVAICQPQNRDRPQWLRAAAEMISGKKVIGKKLIFLAQRERCTRILADLSAQALKAEPEHDLWREIREVFRDAKPLSESLIHWTRLTSKRAESRRGRIPHRPLAK